MQTIIRLLNSNPEWQATGVITDNEAMAAFNATNFRLVLLGSGIENESEAKLCNHFKSINPSTTIVQHYGGGSGLLSAEIYEALK